MKNVLIILSALFIMVSCNNQTSKTELEQAKEMVIDSMKNQATLEQVKQMTIDSMKIVEAKQASADSVRQLNESKTNKGVSSKISAGDKTTNTAVSSTSTAPTVAKKKKMSGAVKGALIGGGVGAVSGAIISRNNKPLKGALIGGLIGAGVGAGTGAIIDSKNKSKN